MNELRRKVADRDGFDQEGNGYMNGVQDGWCGIKNGFLQRVPHYDTSIDAIAQCFDEHNFIWSVGKTLVNGRIQYVAAVGDQSCFGDTAAIALCELFVELYRLELRMDD